MADGPSREGLTPPRPIWWPVIEQWGLAHHDPARIRRRLDRIFKNRAQSEKFIGDLLSQRPPGPLTADESPKASDLPAPAIRLLGSLPEDDAMAAACLTYRTVILPDPVYIVLSWTHVALKIYEDLPWETIWLSACRSSLPEAIALASAGVAAFEVPFGPVALADEYWARVPDEIKKDWEHMDGFDKLVVGEVVWAAARARANGAMLGTAEPRFERVLRTVRPTASVSPVEVPVLLPYVSGLDVRTLIALRERNDDSLSRFRSALYTLTAELRDLVGDDLKESRVRTAVHDYLDGALGKLENEWKALVVVGGGGLVGAAGSLLTVTATFGMAPPLGGTLPSLATGSAALLAAGAALIAGKTYLASNDLYVLWRATRMKRQTRSAPSFATRSAEQLAAGAALTAGKTYLASNDLDVLWRATRRKRQVRSARRQN